MPVISEGKIQFMEEDNLDVQNGKLKLRAYEFVVFEIQYVISHRVKGGGRNKKGRECSAFLYTCRFYLLLN